MIGDRAVLRASQWCYRGVWSVVTKWLYVPEEPPRLEGADDRVVHSFRPAEGYLKYIKLYFWIGLAAIDFLLIVGWIIVLVLSPMIGLLIAPLAWAIIILPDIVAYIAIHLRYDTTWYVLSDRSMRIRRGIWTIHETTITYENIQNVSIRQGPIERHFGISNILVETAGGGAVGHEGAKVVGHHGLLEGIDNAAKVRNLILAKWQSAKSTGLGDDMLSPSALASTWPDKHRHWNSQQVAVLQEIRDLVAWLAACRT